MPESKKEMEDEEDEVEKPEAMFRVTPAQFFAYLFLGIVLGFWFFSFVGSVVIRTGWELMQYGWGAFYA